MSVPLPIVPTQIVALNDYQLPFSNWSYNNTLITAAGWTVFFTLYAAPNTIAANQGQYILSGPTVVTISSPGAGTPTALAEYLTPQALFLARTQAFNTPSLSSPPTNYSGETITSDVWLQTGG